VDWTPLLVAFGVFLFSLSVHESAHALTARWLGDDTGYLLGRITLNPVPHIDPVGTLLLPAILLYTSNGQMVFGWAKPVPYQPFRLRNPFLGSAAVAAAGPGSNFLLATLSAVLLGLTTRGGAGGTLGHEVLQQLLFLNVLLGLFNLLPLPPLDGGTIVGGLLPRRAAATWARMDTLGPVILLVLIATRSLDRVLYPAVEAVLRQLAVLVRGIRG